MPIKVVVLYRVLQEWRRPMFERLSQLEDIDFTLIHGPDFKNSKVVSSQKEVHFKRLRTKAIKIRKQSKNGLIAMPLSPGLFFHLIKMKPDVIITEGASNLLNAVIAFIYCKLFNKSFVWWSLGKLKNTVHTGLRAKIDTIVQYLEKRSTAIISYSSRGKDYFRSIGIKEEKIFVAVNVVDTERVLNKINQFNGRIKKEDSFNILFVGALIVQKRIDILLNAFQILEKERPNVKLTIVGDGPQMKFLKQQTKKQQIKNIVFTGRVFEGVEKHFLLADVFVLPGLGGLAISEAMTYGLPVIAGIGDGCESDLIEHGKNGLIDEGMSAQSLANNLMHLYDNPALIKKFKTNSKQQIIQQYNVNTYIEKIHQAILFATK